MKYNIPHFVGGNRILLCIQILHIYSDKNRYKVLKPMFLRAVSRNFENRRKNKN